LIKSNTPVDIWQTPEPGAVILKDLEVRATTQEDRQRIGQLLEKGQAGGQKTQFFPEEP
jgi:hypothetical protein